MIYFITKDSLSAAQVSVLPGLVDMFREAWLDAERVLISEDGEEIVFEKPGSSVRAHVPEHLRAIRLTPPLTKFLGLN